MFLRRLVSWPSVDIHVKFYGDRPRGTLPLAFDPPTEVFSRDDLRKILRGCQRMAKVASGIEKLPKISTCWVGCTNVTGDRRTDGRRHIANVNMSSRSPLLIRQNVFVYSSSSFYLNQATWPIDIQTREIQTDRQIYLYCVVIIVVVQCLLFVFNFRAAILANKIK